MKALASEKGMMMQEVVLELLDEDGRTLRTWTGNGQITSRGRCVDEREAKDGIVVVGKQRVRVREGVLRHACMRIESRTSAGDLDIV